MTVDVYCKSCGQLAYFNFNQDYHTVTKIVTAHKQLMNHNIKVSRL